MDAREAAMREEQEKIRIKRQLTNNINHELKTPVASMQVCLETLLSGISLTEEKRQELIERCYANAERLRRLLGDVSLITRMEDGSALIAKQPVCLNDIINEVAEEVAIMPADERMEVHINMKERVEVEGNLMLISSIFQNLTENALDYSGGKNIYITLLENNAEVCRLRFEDDGRGVASAELPRLFERFYRVDKGRSRRMGGTGLGLAIVKSFVEMMGGDISFVSEYGKGTKFMVNLWQEIGEKEKTESAVYEENEIIPIIKRESGIIISFSHFFLLFGLATVFSPFNPSLMPYPNSFKTDDTFSGLVFITLLIVV